MDACCIPFCSMGPCSVIPKENYAIIGGALFIAITTFVIGMLCCEGTIMDGTASFFVGAGLLTASFIAFCLATCKACCANSPEG